MFKIFSTYKVPGSRSSTGPVENLLKEVLETRISERNAAYRENSRLSAEVVALLETLADKDRALADQAREMKEIFTQNCLLEAIVRNKNEKVANFNRMEARVRSLESQNEVLCKEIEMLHGENDELIAEVERDKCVQAEMLKEFTLHVRDLVEENHCLQEEVVRLEQSLKEARDEFRTVWSRLAKGKDNVEMLRGRKYK